MLKRAAHRALRARRSLRSKALTASGTIYCLLAALKLFSECVQENLPVQAQVSYQLLEPHVLVLKRFEPPTSPGASAPNFDTRRGEYTVCA